MGYNPSFFCVFIQIHKNTQKKEIERYPAILTGQAWLLRIYHNLSKENIVFCEKKRRRSPELAIKVHLAGEWLWELSLAPLRSQPEIKERLE